MKSLGLQVGIEHVTHVLFFISNFQDAGYHWVNIDDCYAEKNRSADGFIVPGKLGRCS